MECWGAKNIQWWYKRWDWVTTTTVSCDLFPVSAVCGTSPVVGEGGHVSAHLQVSGVPGTGWCSLLRDERRPGQHKQNHGQKQRREWNIWGSFRLSLLLPPFLIFSPALLDGRDRLPSECLHTADEHQHPRPGFRHHELPGETRQYVSVVMIFYTHTHSYINDDVFTAVTFLSVGPCAEWKATKIKVGGRCLFTCLRFSLHRSERVVLMIRYFLPREGAQASVRADVADVPKV